jgi:hypothetical protein
MPLPAMLSQPLVPLQLHFELDQNVLVTTAPSSIQTETLAQTVKTLWYEYNKVLETHKRGRIMDRARV